jgi:hypothetical protein
MKTPDHPARCDANSATFAAFCLGKGCRVAIHVLKLIEMDKTNDTIGRAACLRLFRSCDFLNKRFSNSENDVNKQSVILEL